MKRNCTAALAALCLLSLAACARPATVERVCPEPVYPTEAALTWLEGTDPPPAFVEFFDRYERQQQVIEACR